MSTAVAAVLLGSVTVYAIFGGADFGAGFWDLFAGNADRGERRRAVIDNSIGPVWEANHVWLILCFVVLWTAFPEAYASITLTLFVPLSLAAFGIVLRGSSFAFRHAVFATPERRRFGAMFAISSIIVPFCLGAVAGSIASGRVPNGGRAGDAWDSWVNPTSVLGGILAVATVAFLAAVFLTWDSARLADATMVDYFRRRALASAVVAGTIALAGILVLRVDAEYLFDGLTSRALPLVVGSAAGGVGAILLLLRGAYRTARVFAVGAVASIIVAWGVAQWDFLLPESLTIDGAAAPAGTLAVLLVVTALAVVIIVPAFVLLYVLDQKGLLPEAGVDEASYGTETG